MDSKQSIGAMKNVLLAVLSGLSMQVTAQNQAPILGVRLGEDFKSQFSDCGAGQRDNWCWTSNDKIFLMPPDSESPTALPVWVKREKLYPRPNSEGKLDFFNVSTLGPRVQGRVITAVTERFGEPTYQSKEVKQTSGGAQFEVIYSRWSTSTTVVTHDCGRVDECKLSFFTAEAYEKLVERARINSERKL